MAHQWGPLEELVVNDGGKVQGRVLRGREDKREKKQRLREETERRGMTTATPLDPNPTCTI